MEVIIDPIHVTAPVPDINASPDPPIQNWTPENDKTLIKWENSLRRATWIYQMVLDRKKRKYNIILVITLILNSIAALISAVSTTILTQNSSDYKLVPLIMNATLLTISMCTTCLNGTIKIYGFDADIAVLAAYIEKLDQLYAIMLGQRLLSHPLRQDAVTFISDQAKIYTQLNSQSPPLSTTLYAECEEAYNKYIQSGMMYNIKFGDAGELSGCSVEFN